ncbi:MAG: oligosaccharide flippase family protein [Candidatus Eisenbacteria bacterium]
MFEEIKKLVKQSAIYGIGTVATPFIGFVMLPLYSRYLTPGEYGVLAVTGVVNAFLSVLISFGANSGLIRYYFAYGEKRDKEEVVVSSLAFCLLASIACILLFLLASREVSALVFDFEKGLLYFRLVIFSAFMHAGILNCLAALRAEERPGVYSVITILSLVLTFCLNILFVVGLRRNVQGILEAELISTTVAHVVALAIVLRGKRLAFSWLKTKQVLSFGLPLVPGSVAVIVLALSDRYFLQHFATLKDVGLFSMGFKIATVLRILIVEPFRMAWPPYMFSVLDRHDAKEIYRKVLVYFTFACVWFGLCLSIFAREGLAILATPPFYPAHKVVPLLVLSQLLLGMCAVLGAGIHIMSKTKYASYASIAAAVVSVGMNFVLVPRLGMMGAALASVVAYLTLNVLLSTISHRLYPVQHEFKRIALMFIVAFGIYGVSLAATHGRGFVTGLIIKLGLVLLFPTLLYFLGFFAKQELSRLREWFSARISPRPREPY